MQYERRIVPQYGGTFRQLVSRIRQFYLRTCSFDLGRTHLGTRLHGERDGLGPSRLVALFGWKDLGVKENKRQRRYFLYRDTSGSQAIVKLASLVCGQTAFRDVVDL